MADDVGNRNDLSENASSSASSDKRKKSALEILHNDRLKNTEKGQEHDSENQEEVRFYPPNNAQQLAKDCNSYPKPLTPLEIKAEQKLGKYKIIKLLSDEGGFGNVFLAEDTEKDTKLKKDVAIKVLKPADNNGQIEQEDIEQFCKEIEEFCNEIETQAKLRHRNIVSLLDSGRFGNVPFFVMEYMEGGTLEKKVKENPDGMDPKQVAEYMEGPGNGLAEMHDKGFVHRDVKPANLLLDKNNEGLQKNKSSHDTPGSSDLDGTNKNLGAPEVKVGDLGRVAPIGTKGLSGSNYYLAPEQVNDEACYSETAEARPQSNTEKPEQVNNGICYPGTDVYGLGVTALELCTGKKPQECMEIDQDQQVKIKDWEDKHRLTWKGMQEDLRNGYLSKKLYKWVISKHVLKADTNESREFSLVLSRAVDKDLTKRPSARAFVRGLWQAVLSPEQLRKRSEKEKDLDTFYEKHNRDERRTYYLDHENKSGLLEKLTLGYCLDLYQSLEGQEYREKRIELCKMLEPKMLRKLYKILKLKPEQQDVLFGEIMAGQIYEEPKDRTKLYKILKHEQQKELVRKLDLEKQCALYQDLIIQEGRTKLYKMLKQEQQSELAGNFEIKIVEELHNDIKEQEGRTKLYKMLKQEQQSELVGNLEIKIVEELYNDIKEQEERTKLYKMLNKKRQGELARKLRIDDINKLYKNLKVQKCKNLYIELYVDIEQYKKNDLVKRNFENDEITDLYQGLKEQGYIKEHERLYKILSPRQKQDIDNIISINRDLEEPISKKRTTSRLKMSEKGRNNLEKFGNIMKLGGGVYDTHSEDSTDSEIDDYTVPSNLRSQGRLGKGLGLPQRKLPELDDKDKHSSTEEKQEEQSKEQPTRPKDSSAHPSEPQVGEVRQVFVDRDDDLRREDTLERPDSKGRSDGDSSSSRLLEERKKESLSPSEDHQQVVSSERNNGSLKEQGYQQVVSSERNNGSLKEQGYQQVVSSEDHQVPMNQRDESGGDTASKGKLEDVSKREVVPHTTVDGNSNLLRPKEVQEELVISADKKEPSSSKIRQPLKHRPLIEPEESGAGSSVDSGNVQEVSVREELVSLQETQKNRDDAPEPISEIHVRQDNSASTSVLKSSLEKPEEEIQEINLFDSDNRILTDTTPRSKEERQQDKIKNIRGEIGYSESPSDQDIVTILFKNSKNGKIQLEVTEELWEDVKNGKDQHKIKKELWEDVKNGMSQHEITDKSEENTNNRKMLQIEVTDDLRDEMLKYKFDMSDLRHDIQKSLDGGKTAKEGGLADKENELLYKLIKEDIIKELQVAEPDEKKTRGDSIKERFGKAGRLTRVKEICREYNKIVRAIVEEGRLLKDNESKLIGLKGTFDLKREEALKGYGQGWKEHDERNTAEYHLRTIRDAVQGIYNHLDKSRTETPSLLDNQGSQAILPQDIEKIQGIDLSNNRDKREFASERSDGRANIEEQGSLPEQTNPDQPVSSQGSGSIEGDKRDQETPWSSRSNVNDANYLAKIDKAIGSMKVELSWTTKVGNRMRRLLTEKHRSGHVNDQIDQLKKAVGEMRDNIVDLPEELKNKAFNIISDKTEYLKELRLLYVEKKREGRAGRYRFKEELKDINDQLKTLSEAVSFYKQIHEQCMGPQNNSSSQDTPGSSNLDETNKNLKVLSASNKENAKGVIDDAFKQFLEDYKQGNTSKQLKEVVKEGLRKRWNEHKQSHENLLGRAKGILQSDQYKKLEICHKNNIEALYNIFNCYLEEKKIYEAFVCIQDIAKNIEDFKNSLEKTENPQTARTKISFDILNNNRYEYDNTEAISEELVEPKSDNIPSEPTLEKYDTLLKEIDDKLANNYETDIIPQDVVDKLMDTVDDLTDSNGEGRNIEIQRKIAVLEEMKEDMDLLSKVCQYQSEEENKAVEAYVQVLEEYRQGNVQTPARDTFKSACDAFNNIRNETNKEWQQQAFGSGSIEDDERD